MDPGALLDGIAVLLQALGLGLLARGAALCIGEGLRAD